MEWPSPAIPNLPRLLIVDDELGRIHQMDEEGNYVLSERARNSLRVQRDGFCRRFVIDEEAAATAPGNIARGRFVSGQTCEGGVFRNDPAAIDKAIAEIGEDCALILMDLRFCEGVPDENGLSQDVTFFRIELAGGPQRKLPHPCGRGDGREGQGGHRSGPGVRGVSSPVQFRGVGPCPSRFAGGPRNGRAASQYDGHSLRFRSPEPRDDAHAAGRLRCRKRSEVPDVAVAGGGPDRGSLNWRN